MINSTGSVVNEKDCNQTAMGLPLVPSAVFLIAKYFGKMWVSLRNI
jgi:hypothetical protein